MKQKRKLILALLVCACIYIYVSFIKSQIVEKNRLYLLVLILSRPENFEQRFAIRNTWVNQITETDFTQYVFVIGESHLNANANEKLNEEMKYNDIIKLSIEDSYSNLTFKLLLSLKTVDSKYEFSYLLKCDDDTYVNFKSFISELKRQEHPMLYWGYFNGKAPVFVKGAWKESRWNLCDRYLPYALGGGYILSRHLVNFINTNRKYLRMFKSEDVSVGTWLSGLNTRRVHDIRFDTEYRTRGCHEDFLLRHKQSPQDLMNTYQHFLQTGNICINEYDTTKRPYSYNWTNLPSQCCKLVDPSDGHSPKTYSSE